MFKVYGNAHGNYIVITTRFHSDVNEDRMMTEFKRLSAWHGVTEYFDNGDLKWEVQPKNIIEFTNLALQLIR